MQHVHRRRLPLQVARAQERDERRQNPRADCRELAAAARLGELLQRHDRALLRAMRAIAQHRHDRRERTRSHERRHLAGLGYIGIQAAHMGLQAM